MLGIEKVSLLPSELAMSIIQFVDEWADSEVDDWAIFLMDAVNCAYDEMRLDDDKVRAALDSAFASNDVDEKARAVIATLRMGEDGYEDKLRELTASQDRYNPIVAGNMQAMLMALGCEEELFEAPQMPETLSKLHELAAQGNWVVKVDDDDRACLGDLAKWALNLLTV